MWPYPRALVGTLMCTPEPSFRKFPSLSSKEWSPQATGQPELSVGTREEIRGHEISVRRDPGKGAVEDGPRKIDQTPVSLHLWLEVCGPDHSFPVPGQLGDSTDSESHPRPTKSISPRNGSPRISFLKKLSKWFRW